MALDHTIEPGHAAEPSSPTDVALEPLPVSSTRANGAALALSIETNRVQGLLLEYVSGVYRLVAWSSMPHYVGKDIPAQVANLCHKIGVQINRTLWDDKQDAPLLQSTDRIRYPPLDYVTLAASPRPLLRTWIVALSTTHSLAAAEQAVASAPAQIIGRTVLDAEISAGSLTRSLISARPDAVIVVGGFDTANTVAQQPVRLLTAIVTNVMQSLPAHMRPFLLFAGNQWVGVDFDRQLRNLEDLSIQIAPNVMPDGGIIRQAALAHALSNHYQNACYEFGNIEQVSQWITSPVRIASAESFFARLVHVWMDANDLTELHGLYCAADRWVHVWASSGVNEVRILYTQPGQYPTALREWPHVELLSGPWASVHGPPPQATWWDRLGMAPAIAAIGQFSPVAMLQSLEADVLMKLRHSPQSRVSRRFKW